MVAAAFGTGTTSPVALPFKIRADDLTHTDNSGGIMAVPRAAIHYLPVEFYENLREQVGGSVEPETGHFLERSWLSVFSGKASYRPLEVLTSA